MNFERQRRRGFAAIMVLLLISSVPQKVMAQEIEPQTEPDSWYLVARDSLGTESVFPMACVGSLVALDESSDFCVLDTLGNVLVEGIVKVTFRPDEMPLAVKSLAQAENTISGVATNRLILIGVSGNVEIFDAKGVLQISTVASGTETSISIASLPTGIYIVRVGKQTFKFTKK